MTEPPTPSTGGSSPPSPPVYWATPATPLSPAGEGAPFRSAGTRARWVLGLLGANIVASAISALISFSGKGTIAAFESGEADLADLEAFDAAFAGFALVETAVFIAAAIAWLAWQSRTVDNETALGIGPSRVTPRWSMGWWFVPFANLVMPYRVHREINDRYRSGPASGGALVIAWWLAYLVANLGTTVVGRIWLAAETFPELQTGLDLWIASEIVTIVAAVLAFHVVKRIQAAADALAARPSVPEAVASAVTDPDPGPPAG